MNNKQLAVIDGRLEDFLSRITPVMGRVERRQCAKTYICGLLPDGDRKSIEPMAVRMGQADGQALQQFVSQSPWSSLEVQRRVLQEVVTGLGEPEVWVIDETSFPKAGAHSVGVARQYCGASGKIANCQVAVSLHRSGAHGGCPVGWKLFLPESWLEDAERARRAGIPAEVKFASKGELALALVDEALAAGLPPTAVTANGSWWSGRRRSSPPAITGSAKAAPVSGTRRSCVPKCGWPRRAGGSSRITGNSRRNSVWTTMRAGADWAGSTMSP